MRMKRLPHQHVLGGLGLTILLIVAVGAFSYVSTARTVSRAEDIGRTFALVQALSDISADLQTTRMCARGFVLTGDEDLQQMHDASRQRVEDRLAALGDLGRGDRIQQQRLAAIRPLVESKLQNSDELIRIRRKSGRMNAAMIALSQYRADLDDPMWKLVSAMNAEARARLAEKTALGQTSRSRLLSLVVTGSLLLLGVSLLAAITIRNDLRLRRISEEELLNQTIQLIGAKNAMEKQAKLLESKSRQLEQARLSSDAANAAKSTFLANMSHEIRTPMTAILGYTDMLLEAGGDVAPSERQEWLQVVRRNGKHLLELINDILDLSKIEAGKMAMEHAPCDVRQIVDDVVQTLRSRAREKRILLRLEFGGGIPREVKSDALRLRQVLVNLVGNAIKFTDAGEVAVRVAWQQSGDCRLLIDVADTGIGMSAQQVGRLFRPFTQADGSTTRRFGGTGLGLTISKRLVELLGGELSVRSEPGAGSTFRVALPTPEAEMIDVDATAAPAECARAADVELPSEERLLHGRILLVDDGIDNQRLLAMLLRKAGAEVTIADTGRSALDAIEGDEFDLVLMDMQMPDMDGYSAVSALRERGCGTPVIAVTAHAMAGDRERCLAAGCTDYLAKPIDRSLLLRTVSMHLCAAMNGAGAA
jgi:signal transduction histidine kinase/ActR/RegA family two-component response regulator